MNWLDFTLTALLLLLLFEFASRDRQPRVPCHRCARLVRDESAVHGTRCSAGDTSDMVGDFSCFRERP